MGFFSELRQANITVDQLDQMIRGFDFGEETAAGVRVSPESATRQATVFSCINILSRDMAALSIDLFERTADGGKAKVESHPVAEWLRRPNSAMTGYQFRQLRWVHTLIYGNTFSLVNGGVNSFRTWPLHPDSMRVGLTPSGFKKYRFTDPSGQPKEYQAHRILHSYGIPAIGGYQGLSPIRWNMEAMGRAIAVGEYAASYFRSPVPKVVLKSEAGMKDKADRDTFVKEWGDRFAGRKGMTTAAILPRGLDLAQVVKVPNNEAQFIETSRFTKEEIAQIYLMPMHRLQGLERATFNNIEHLDLEYVKYTLMPWLKSDEEALESQFLSPAERGRFLIRHNMDTLLRGDFKSRMEGHRSAVGGPIRTVNESRALENLPPIEGGDEVMRPLNMALASDWAINIKGGQDDGTDS